MTLQDRRLWPRTRWSPSPGRWPRVSRPPAQGRRPSWRRRAAVVFFGSIAATPLLAHDFWIDPDSFRPQTGTVVAVHLRVGQNLEGDLVPRADRMIERFALVTEGGDVPIVGPDAGEPAGRVRPEAAGPAMIVYRSLTTSIELEAAKFEAYLREEGLETIIDERAARGDHAKPGKEIYSRCAKSLLRVEPAAPAGAAGGQGRASNAPQGASTTAKAGKASAKTKDKRALYQRPVGLTLEILPLADPYAMKPGARLPVQILHEGKPIANILVVAMNAEAPMGKVQARSDKTGRASLALDRPGFWLVKAVHMRPAPPSSGADWESLWASLTLELPDPGNRP